MYMNFILEEEPFRREVRAFLAAKLDGQGHRERERAGHHVAFS